MAASATHSLLSLSKPKPKPSNLPAISLLPPLLPAAGRISPKPYQGKFNLVAAAVGDGFDVIPVQSEDRVDQPDGAVSMERECEATEADPIVGAFGSEASGRLSFEVGFSSTASTVGGPGPGPDKSREEMERLVGRTINAAVALAAAPFAITKLLTIDQDYWHVS